MSAEDMTIGPDYLDVNKTFPITYEVKEEGANVRIHANLDLSEVTNPRFKKNLLDHLALSIGEEGQALQRETFDGEGNTYFASMVVPRDTLRDHGLKLTVNHVPVNSYIWQNKGLQPVVYNQHLRMTVSETRMLGRAMTEEQLQRIPYPRDFAPHFNEMRKPVTDLHTHLSSQIPGSDLVEMSARHDAVYPLELLEEMGIDASGLATYPIKSFRFDPAIYTGVAKNCELDPEDPSQDKSKLVGVKIRDLKKKQPADYKTFIRNMSIPVDQIFGPGDFDTKFYRFRNPLEKNPELARDKIMQVAENYKAEGIKYAELSTGAMLSPEWLREAIPAIEEAEAKTGVKLRLLVGIPRSKSPDAVSRDIENMKFVAQCPYIVGVDFLGFESNKTEDFTAAIYNIARWAQRLRNNRVDSDEYGRYTDDFVIRVHAGENDKNIGNVGAAIDIADRFKVRLRVGHAAYARLTDESTAKAKKNGVMMEFIPDSNIALRNIRFIEDIKMPRWMEKGVKFVLGSDGSGGYQTSADQLARAGIACGLSIQDLGQMQGWENDLIATQDRVFEDKKGAFDHSYKKFDDFVDAYDKHRNYVRSMELPERFEGKTPILIAGASGSRWEQIEPEHQFEVSIAARMMTKLLDPDKVYFCTGRVKNRGVEKELDNAIDSHNAKHWRDENHFDMIATVSTDQGPVSIANGVTWVNRSRGDTNNVVSAVTRFMQEHGGGYSLFVGGAAFTREFIHQAADSHAYEDRAPLPFGMMTGDVGANGERTGPKGAANSEADVVDPKHHIKAGRSVTLAESTLRHMRDTLRESGQDVFRQGVDLSDDALRNLYKETKREVAREIEDAAREMQGWTSRSGSGRGGEAAR